MSLSATGGGNEADALFYEAARRCEREPEVRVMVPERVRYGPDDIYEYHRCADGEWGRLHLLYPPTIARSTTDENDPVAHPRVQPFQVRG